MEPSIGRNDLTAHYSRVLAEQVRTGASTREIAGNYGVTPGTLYAWRRRLLERGEAPGVLIADDVVSGSASRANSKRRPRSAVSAGPRAGFAPFPGSSVGGRRRNG